MIEVGHREQKSDFWFVLLSMLQTRGDPDYSTRYRREDHCCKGWVELYCRNERGLLLESTAAPFAITLRDLALAEEEETVWGSGLLRFVIV